MRRVVGLVGAVMVGLLAGCGSPVRVPAPAVPSPASVAQDLAVVAGGGIAVPAAKQLPAKAAIGGPDYAVRLAEVGTAERLEPVVVAQFGKMQSATGVPRDATGSIAAGPGKEFLFVRLAEVPGVKREPSPKVTARLRVGEQARPVEGLVAPNTVVVALVPAGAPVTLVVTNESRDQSVDVRTGAVGAGAVAAYLKPRPFGETTYSVTGQVAGDAMPSKVDITVSAALEPYDHRQQGTWAPAGRTWLRVWVDVTVMCVCTLAGTVDLKQSLQVSAGGKVITVEATTTKVTQETVPDTDFTIADEVRMDVAEGSVQALTVRFEPKGALTRNGKPTTLKLNSTPQQRITLK